MTMSEDDDLPVLVTSAEAAVLAHVEPVTIRVWCTRGKLRPVARTSAGHLLFTLADVFAATRRAAPT